MFEPADGSAKNVLARHESGSRTGTVVRPGSEPEREGSSIGERHSPAKAVDPGNGQVVDPAKYANVPVRHEKNRGRQ
jgi:hypothetical protein